MRSPGSCSLLAPRPSRGRAGAVLRGLLLALMVAALLPLPGAQGWAAAAAEGQRLASEHRLNSAIQRYREVALHPGAASYAGVRVGRLHLRRGHWAEAAEAFRQADAGGSGNGEALLGLAQALHRLGDAVGGVEALRRELRLRPGNAEAWLLLVERAARAGIRPAELASLLDGVPLPPEGSPEAYRADYLYGSCVLGPDSPEGASHLLRAVAGPDPEVSFLASELLEAAGASGDPVVGAASLARALLAHGLVGPALDSLDRVPQASPHYGEVLALRGYALLRLGRLEEARTALDASLERESGHPLSTVLMGSLLRVRGDPEGAVRLLERAARQGPSNPAIQAELANSLAALGEYDEAGQALQLAAQMAPEDPDLRLAAAAFYVDRQYRVADAVADAREAIRLSGRSPASLGTLGWALHLLGDSQEALGLLEEAVAGDPESALLRYRLGSAYQTLERWEEAREQHLMVGEVDGPGGHWQRSRAALAAMEEAP